MDWRKIIDAKNSIPSKYVSLAQMLPFDPSYEQRGTLVGKPVTLFTCLRKRKNSDLPLEAICFCVLFVLIVQVE